MSGYCIDLFDTPLPTPTKIHSHKRAQQPKKTKAAGAAVDRPFIGFYFF